MTDWLDWDRAVGPSSRPARWHLAQVGIEVPDDATEQECWQAAMNVRELILRWWADTGQQEHILIESPSMHSQGGQVSATTVLPDLHAIGDNPTRVIPRRTWPLVDPLPDVPTGQMRLL